MKKSWIGTDIVTFFGYEVRPGSWSLSPSAIAAMVFPTNQKQMQSFLGAYFDSHIPNYASWASSLINALLQISLGRNPHGLD
jgi:O-antigen/teichoic acid export membrane protein